MTSNYINILRNSVEDLSLEKLAGKNILITGATGLIGGCICDILMQQNKVNCFVYASGRNIQRAKKRFSTYWNNPYFTFIKIDVTERINLNIDFHFIIDAASNASPKDYITTPVNVIKANIYGVDNLLNYGREHNLQKFVYISSGEVYGEGDGRIFTENYSGYIDPTTIRACYPSSKRTAETMTVCYAKQYNLNVSIARPTHVYGPYFSQLDNRVYAQFIRNVLNNEDIIMKSSGRQFRSWCFVVDCSTAILYIMLKGNNMEAYNVADNTSNVSIRYLAEVIADLYGKKVVIQIPKTIEKEGYSKVTKAIFDTSKLEGLGWHNINFDLKNKLLLTIDECSNDSLCK